MRAELQDRYGDPPAAVRHLLDYAALKLLAMRVGAISIERKRDLVSIKFRENADIDPANLAKIRFVPAWSAIRARRYPEICFQSRVAADVLAQLRGLLEELSPAVRCLSTQPRSVVEPILQNACASP